jgi:hypothetical protein
MKEKRKKKRNNGGLDEDYERKWKELKEWLDSVYVFEEN